MRTLLETLAIGAFLALTGYASVGQLWIEPEDAYECSTDTDCQLHCPPPSDDPDCDGGPADVSFNRGNYWSQP